MVISLSNTISGLHWDRIPGDSDNEVAARGILYLLIFQQLGQLVRWTWGYNVLLAPPGRYVNEERRLLEEGNTSSRSSNDIDRPSSGDTEADPVDATSGEQTPKNTTSRTSSLKRARGRDAPRLMPTPLNGNYMPSQNGVANNDGEETAEDHYSDDIEEDGSQKGGLRALMRRTKRSVNKSANSVFRSLPEGLQSALSMFWQQFTKFLGGVWEFMNPPLWAMLVAIVVASVPRLQRLFFEDGSFIKNSITRAVAQSGGVAVPLILVVLGANLARNTVPVEDRPSTDGTSEKKLLIAALISRMLLPTIIMAPIIAVTAKFVPVSILDDPIFIIVIFLLTGAPSALQLAQICQTNNVYMGAMSKLLFQSYVVW